MASSPRLFLAISLLATVLGRSVFDAAPACGNGPAELVFILDASSSIWGPYFKEQLRFVQSIAQQFQINPTHTRVGVLTFGSYTRTEFDLTRYTDQPSVLAAIGNIYQLLGTTRTDGALLRMRELMSRDSRSGIPRVAMVITDGDSDFAEMTKKEARLAHEAGITIIALGIGGRVGRAELEAIASQPDNVFLADDFRSLTTLNQKLALKFCEVTAGRQPDDLVAVGTTTSTPEDGNWHTTIDSGPSTTLLRSTSITPLQKGCGGKPAEIVFALDGSSSIWAPDFNTQLRFVQDLLGSFDIAQNKTRIGVLTFGDRQHHEFNLGDYELASDIKAAVGGIRQVRGGTNTGKALHAMVHGYFGRNARPGVVKIGIVITDGRSDIRAHTAHKAEAARQTGINLFAIGVGDRTDFRELAAIASHPTSTHVFRVNNYKALGSIRALLAIETCKATEPPTTTTSTTTPTTTTATTTTTTTKPTTTTPLPADQGCGEGSPADLVFALPPLAKMDDTNTALEFIRDVVREFDVSDGKVRLGLVPKECVAVPGFKLRSFGDKQELLIRFKQQVQLTTTDTKDVIKHMRTSSFINSDMMQADDPGYAAAYRRRHDTKKIAVVILDRESDNLRETVEEARLAKEEGIKMFVVTVGKGVPDAEALDIASSLNHVFSVSDYAELVSLSGRMTETMNDACSDIL